MNDDRRNLTDSEVKHILERIPMTERLAESECAEMKEVFLRAIKQSSQRTTHPVISWRDRPAWWVGFGVGAAACVILAFLLFIVVEDGRGRIGDGLPIPSEPPTFDGKAYFGPPQTFPSSATDEIEQSTEEIRSSTDIQLNQVPWESLCGPRSIWVAAAKLGVNLDLEEVVKACRVTEKGCSMLNLKQAAKSFGFAATGLRLDWASLIELEQPAIVLVQGDHFSCIDPTEPSRDGGVRYYDPPSPATWLSEPDLLTIWKGESLVLSLPARSRPSGPSITFKSILNDLGLITDANSISGTFTFRNSGTDPLEILEMNHSCGCIHTEVTKNPVLPGETAEIVAELGLQGIDGPRSEMIEVKTNDPSNPSVTLVLQADHRRSLVLSEEFVDFGVVSASTPSDRHFVIEDKSETEIPILGSEVRLDTPLNPAPTISVSYERFESRPGAHGPSYEFNLQASCTPETPIGSFEGTILIHAGQEGERTIEIAFQVRIESDYLIIPPHISFGVVREGEAIQRSIVVRSRANQAIRLKGHEVRCDTEACSINLTRPSRPLDSIPIDLSLSIPDSESNETKVAKGSLILRPERGPEFEVPWSAIVKKGH